MTASTRLWPNRSFSLTAFGRPLTRMQAGMPGPSGDQVLVRVLACGVCHSDLHIADGYFDLGGDKRLDIGKGVRLPRTLGHEICGVVVAVGDQVQDVAVGDRRVLYPWIGCGGCALCLAGQEHLCPQPLHHGLAADGGFADLVMVPHPRYLLPFGDLDAGYAATLACSGLTAFSALRKAAPVSADHPLLIIGAGGVGLAAVAIARALHGVGAVVAELDPARRQAALDAGASDAVDPTDPEVRRRLTKQTGGGFASVVDFVGAQPTAEFGMGLLRKGGKMVFVGLFGGSVQLSLPMLPMRAISLIGSYVGTLEEMRELLVLARDGALKPMHVERRPLESAQATMDDLRRGRINGRAVLVPERVD